MKYGFVECTTFETPCLENIAELTIIVGIVGGKVLKPSLCIAKAFHHCLVFLLFNENKNYA